MSLRRQGECRARVRDARGSRMVWGAQTAWDRTWGAGGTWGTGPAKPTGADATTRPHTANDQGGPYESL
jgi:hypothetical protein